MDIRVQLSSCVPSTHMETTGARLEAADLIPLRDHPRTSGLAEFMNYPGVIHRDAGCMAKLQTWRGRHIDGHAPLLTGGETAHQLVLHGQQAHAIQRLLDVIEVHAAAQRQRVAQVFQCRQIPF